jgi:ketopantoate reductase
VGRKLDVCVVGAGAIGGFLGARLAAAGDANVGAIARGRTLAVPTPNIDALLGLTRLFARAKGLYPEAPSAPVAR